MVSRAKYRRVPDLYTIGTEVVLADGTPMWVQVPNPFQYDEARHDASVARSRIVMALREIESDELVKLRGTFLEMGREAAAQDMVDAKSGEFMVKAFDQIRSDKEWREKLEIVERSDELLARPAEDSERQLLEKIAEDYSAEMSRRLAMETEFLVGHYARMDEDDLWREFKDFYTERRGNDAALNEFKLTEMWYAVRCCDGVQVDGEWDHAACDGHRDLVYETKAEVKALPVELQAIIFGALQQVSMSEREAKKSPSQGSSSASSPLPSEGEALTASTPSETPDVHPGPSPSPSTTPSPFSAG